MAIHCFEDTNVNVHCSPNVAEKIDQLLVTASLMGYRPETNWTLVNVHPRFVEYEFLDSKLKYQFTLRIYLKDTIQHKGILRKRRINVWDTDTPASRCLLVHRFKDLTDGTFTADYKISFNHQEELLAKLISEL